MDRIHVLSPSTTSENESDDPQRLAIPTSDGIAFIALDDITHLQAEGSYTTIHCVNGDRYVVSLNLRAVETRLPSKGFFRCHHSHVVNLSKVVRLMRNGGHHTILETGDTVTVSRRKWAGLVAVMRDF